MQKLATFTLVINKIKKLKNTLVKNKIIDIIKYVLKIGSNYEEEMTW